MRNVIAVALVSLLSALSVGCSDPPQRFVLARFQPDENKPAVMAVVAMPTSTSFRECGSTNYRIVVTATTAELFLIGTSGPPFRSIDRIDFEFAWKSEWFEINVGDTVKPRIKVMVASEEMVNAQSRSKGGVILTCN